MCPTGIKRLRESVTARAVSRLIWEYSWPPANGDYILTRSKVSLAVSVLRQLRKGA
jgi:hypothetical protein